jgi:hypothetical protein
MISIFKGLPDNMAEQQKIKNKGERKKVDE